MNKVSGFARRSVFIGLSLLLVVFSLSAQKPDRTKPPELGPPPSMKLPPIPRFTLSNGMNVVLMEKHDVPLVQINVLVRSGSAMDPVGKKGLASLTSDMMDEGAGTRDALQLADAIDFLGARISSSAGMHTSVVGLFTPTSKLGEALPLLADVVMRPTFPPSELDRLRKERLTTLLQWHDEPRAIASVKFNSAIFGSKHPYGLPSMGDEKSIRGFTVEDLRRFHGDRFHAGNASMIVVGAVQRGEIQTKLEALFGTWERRTAPSVSWPSVSQVAARTVTIVDKPGAAQSEIRIGRIGVERLTDDYFSIVVMNTVLGGSFTSRLNQNLRETHGYTYGAGSSFDMRPLPGPFLASSAVQTDVTDKALTEFMKELNGILEPITDEELVRVRNYVALSYPSGFQSVGQIASQLNELVTYGLPENYFNTYIEKVLAVTKEDVQRVARKYLDPSKVAVVIVGDLKKIEKGVRDLKLGSMKTESIQDVLGKPPRL
ncbi:MAG: insulinase family protein [Ignavibacteria bacterium]|nr:insulinase family protein [Ignavibacteria bacterium]